jgi:hypothetical protein
MDTLRIDSTQIAAWQSDGRYDYDREIVGGSQNLLEWLASVINQWLADLFDTALDNDVVYYSLMVVGALAALFIGWLLWKHRSRLFYGKKEDEAMDYEVEEDSIYGVDFDAELAETLAHDDYRQAVRLVYLQTLLHLQNAGRIEWQPSKTPTQYMRQVNDPAFSRLTRLFVLVRYGNFDATCATFDEVKALQRDVIQKGGAPHE